MRCRGITKKQNMFSEDFQKVRNPSSVEGVNLIIVSVAHNNTAPIRMILLNQ